MEDFELSELNGFEEYFKLKEKTIKLFHEENANTNPGLTMDFEKRVYLDEIEVFIKHV